MKKLIIKISVALFSIVLLLGSSGCVSLFVKKDTLTTAPSSPIDASGEDVYSDINITSYEQIFSGSILAYDSQSERAVLTYRTIDEEGNYVSVLASEHNGTIIPLYTTANSYTEAMIDPSNFSIYFKERNTTNNTSALYWSNAAGDTRIRLSEDVFDSYLAWNLTDEGFLVYINAEYNIILGTVQDQLSVYTLPTNFSVKKITYVPEDNFILFIASTPQTSNVLYRLDLDDEATTLTPIDVNISDFSVSPIRALTAYVKTSSGGEDQLYLYDHSSLLRQLVCTNDIDKVSFSPNGDYIAFSTQATTEIPTQSIWIVRYNRTIPIQLTADTKMSGQFFWNDRDDTLIFTRSETTDTDSQTGGETIYTTYQLTFEFTQISSE